MTGIDSWDNFFLGELGVSAALAGLLFVSVSINLERILSFPTLPGRALDAFVLLLLALVVCSLVLVPGQPDWLLGAEIAVGGLCVWLGTSIRDFRALGSVEAARRRTSITNFVLLQFAVLPYLVGGILLVAGSAFGLYWIAAAIIVSIVKSFLDGWVLLVEINR
jgi:modulator of FtsH protease